MNSSIPRPVQQPGERNSATLPGLSMDLALAATACCSLFSFLAGSILHADLGQLPASLPVLFSVSALFLIFAALVRLSGHPGWGFAGLFGLLHLVARHPSPLLTAATIAAALLCLAYLLRKFRLSPKAWSHAAIMGLLGTLAFFSINHVCYTCFDLHNRLTDGSIHIDPLYHSAVASMIKTYGITSTGVNGLPPLNYHVLSHEAIAAISRLYDAPVFSCYGIVPFILFSPLLLFGIASAAMMLAPADFRNRPRPLWLATCLSLILLTFIGSPEPTAGHFIRSESFLVSLGLLCAGLIPLSRNEIKPATILLAALLTLLMSHAKISVGVIYAGLWALRLCFARSASPLREVTATLLVSAAASPFLFSSGSSHPIEFAPLHFFLNFSARQETFQAAAFSLFHGKPFSPGTLIAAAAALVTFCLSHFLPAWAVVAAAARRNLRQILRDRPALFSLGAIAAGTVALAILKVAGGSAIYFSAPAAFVALPFALPGFVRWLQLATASLPGASLNRKLALVTVATCTAIAQFSPGGHPQATLPTATGDFLARMETIRTTSPASAIFRANPGITTGNPITYPKASPFVLPALSERAWTNLLKSEDIPAYLNYGYQDCLSPESTGTHVLPPVIPADLQTADP
ncbi:MAG: hypothetical protein RLZZ179_2410 [Verrucomicrobiota bacterium]